MTGWGAMVTLSVLVVSASTVGGRAPQTAPPTPDTAVAMTQPSPAQPAATQARRRHHRRALAQLSPEQRRVIQQIAKALKQMPPEKRTQMLRALNRYRRWLVSLPPEQQRRVLRMPPAKRLAYMRMFVKLHPPEQIIPVGDPPPEPDEPDEGPFYADDWNPQQDQRQEHLMRLRAFFDRLEPNEKKRLLAMWPDRQERELRRLFYRREILLIQLRRFFKGMGPAQRRELWGLLPDVQERRLRRMFTRRQQMMRTEFFHKVLSAPQRRHILELGRRNPPEAERLFQDWYRQHQAASSPPSPTPDAPRSDRLDASPHGPR